MLEHFIEPERYWAIKGYGRLLLIAAIGVYGVGLLLRRIATEKQEATGTDRCHGR